VDTDFALRLNPHPDGNYFESLSLIDATGEVRWTAYPTVGGPNDVWVDAQLDQDAVSASTWSCYRVRLSVASGEVLEAIFTK
jgi:hypothetical protein